MDTNSLLAALQSDNNVKQYFINVFAHDQLPKHKIKQSSWLLVCNCCPASKPGIHWIAIFKDA